MDNSKKIIRYRVQFRLTTLFLGITFVAAWLGVQVTRVHTQRDAVAVIRRFGGSVGYDFQRHTSRDSTLSKWIRTTFGDDWFGDVVKVSIATPTRSLRHMVLEDQLDAIVQLPAIESLNLGRTNTDDGGIKKLARLANLRTLILYKTKVGDAGLAQLARMKRLESLYLDRTQVGDCGVAHLAGSKSLQFLYLNGTHVTDAGLRSLSGITSLRRLHVLGTRVTPEGIAKLKQTLPQCAIRFEIDGRSTIIP